MSTQPLEAAITATSAVLRGVDADQLESDTPCASWKVRDLINHIVGGQRFFTAMVRGEAVDPSAEQPDWSAGDFVAEFDHGAKETVAAFSEPGVMEKIVHLPFGDMPGAAFVGIAATDTFVHGWDLAKATGQDTNLDPELASALLGGARMFIQDAIRGDEPMPFGPEQSAPANAGSADQLAAFLGPRCSGLALRDHRRRHGRHLERGQAHRARLHRLHRVREG